MCVCVCVCTNLSLEVNDLLYPLIRYCTLCCHQLLSLLCAAVKEPCTHTQTHAWLSRSLLGIHTELLVVASKDFSAVSLVRYQSA